MSASSYPLARERNLILAGLMVLAAAGWAVLLWQAAGAGGTAMGLTMGLSAPLFLATWIAMMVAMMFPTAAPMILTFARVSAGQRERGQAFVPTWVFVAAYLLVWIVFGALAYGLALGAQALGEGSPWLTQNAARIGGVILVLTGLYQLSPLKWVCLSRCRTPLAWVLHAWRDGYVGALRMGLEHGAYCLGCCWLLFVLLFPLGMMNVAAMAAITALIFAEKSLPHGYRVGQVAGLLLITYGVAVVLVPGLLPTAMSESITTPRDMPMPGDMAMPDQSGMPMDMPMPMGWPTAASTPRPGGMPME
jgi:predicted metal-binding membrane protein